MPELPEVETVKESLKQRLIGKTILKATIYYDNIIAYPRPEEFSKKIAGQKILGMSRYGKWIIFELEHDVLLSHLRMEGKYFFRTSSEEKNKHEHVVFSLDDGTELRYMDVRKFGKMHLIPKDKIYEIGPFTEMGLEPWDQKLTPNYLKEKYLSKKLPIKTALLDQKIIVGIGNIYANEILFLSNINPLKSASLLTEDELKTIIKNTKEVLEKAIEKGGTTIRSYTSVDGVHGLFQQELYVHNQEKQPCKKCNTSIVKIKVGGRGTYYCPNCQKYEE